MGATLLIAPPEPLPGALPFSAPPAPLAEPADATAGDTARAVRSGVQLGGSLLATWGVALAVRLLLPRLLGPGRFGQLNFADALAATFFVVIGLGVDIYIRKEIPVRPEHASDFFGGVLAVRLGLTGAATLGLWAALRAGHQSPEVQAAALAFAAYQLVYGLNESQAALLHARGIVGGLAMANVAAKLVWGGAALVAVFRGAPLAWIAGAYLLAEVLKAIALASLARRHLGLRLHFNRAATWAVLVASLPFNLAAMSQTAYAKIPTSLLRFVLQDDAEVGWYGAASGLAGLALLITPVIGWVLMPLFARAASRSADDLTAAVRRATEMLLSVAVPTSLLLALGADVWTQLAFGPAFGPAALSLRLLAPIFVLTYVASVSATTLILLGRGWTVTGLSLVGLVISPALNLLLIRPCRLYFGPGGGGAGCALALCGAETFLTVAMLACLGNRTFDPRSLGLVARAVAVSAAVVGVDTLLRPWPGLLRLGLDAGAYLLLAVPLRALRLTEMLRLTRDALHHREGAHGL